MSDLLDDRDSSDPDDRDIGRSRRSRGCEELT